jgi:hypothetical protein
MKPHGIPAWASVELLSGLLGVVGIAALTLGVDAQWCRMLLLTLATAVTAVVVSLSGTVGFVGLIVPHMLRLIVGPQHHRLLPVSLLGGALFLILADLVARVLVRPQEVRLGIVTAFVGVPFFLYLLRTTAAGLNRYDASHVHWRHSRTYVYAATHRLPGWRPPDSQGYLPPGNQWGTGRHCGSQRRRKIDAATCHGWLAAG